MPVSLHPHMAKATEKQIQDAILQYLSRRSDVVWANRMNTGATSYQDKGGKRRFIRFGFKGLSDIIGQLTDGRFLAIEVKKHNGRATQEQLNFIQAVNNGRGVAMIARSVDDVIAGLEAAKSNAQPTELLKLRA